jgi:hypothetical protein
MGDIYREILQNLYDDIYTESESGGALEWMCPHAVYVVQSPAFFSYDHSTPEPFILIYPGSITLEPDTISCRSDTKDATVFLSIFTEFHDENEGVLGDTTAGTKGIVNMVADIETRYNRNTLSISGHDELECYLQRIIYNQVIVPAYHQAHLQFLYQYIDRRIS